MTEASVSFAGDLTDDPSSTAEPVIARAMFRVGVRSAGAGGVVLMRDLADRAIAWTTRRTYPVGTSPLTGRFDHRNRWHGRRWHGAAPA